MSLHLLRPESLAYIYLFTQGWLVQSYRSSKENSYKIVRRNIIPKFFKNLSIKQIKKFKVPRENLPLQPNSLAVVMVYGALYTGGIDTLIVRLANFLVASGHPVTAYLMPGGDLQGAFDSGIEIYTYCSITELIDVVKRRPRTNDPSQMTLILSFDSSSAARAELVEIAMHQESRIIHVTGIFHPNWYFMPGQPFDRIKLNEWLARSMGAQKIFFMNEECRIAHANYWHMDLSASPVIPLPIKRNEPIWKPSIGPSVRVVSVGRLVDFKAYNLGAPSIVRECLDRGYEVEWDIYGFGPQEEEIRRLSQELGVTHKIRLLGKLNYESFGTTVATYDLFVGMGTAVIESAMVGVPSICATINEARCSYGFISDLPFGNVGEVIQGRTPIDITEIIKNYADLSLEARSSLSERGIAIARRYEIPNFKKALFEMGLLLQPNSRRYLRHFVARLFCELTDGSIAKALLGKGLKRNLIKLLKI
jgi:glycosyltransferase involved in cell wall biosynthesis